MAIESSNCPLGTCEIFLYPVLKYPGRNVDA